MTSRRPELPYTAALDGVRALAVAGVLLYHGRVSWLPGGFLGVDVFFVLSGFLITSLLLAELGGSGGIDLARFWLRRARRLLPAAFLVVGVCVLVAAIFLPSQLGRTRGDALASILYVNNWHQVVASHSYFAAFGRPPLLQHLWSLSVEEQFYLLWPLALAAALKALGPRRTALLTVVLLVASVLAMALIYDGRGDPSRVYYGTDTHSSGLLIGALVAFVWPLGRFRATPRSGAASVLDAIAVTGLAGVVFAMATLRDFDPFAYRGAIALTSLAAVLLIAAVSHPACRVGRVLGAAPFVWIGKRSYGIYLWHWPVMVMTRPGVDIHWPTELLVPAQIALAVLIAAASYRWIEMPIRNGSARAWLDRREPRRRLSFALATTLALLAAIVFVAARPGGGAAASENALGSGSSAAANRLLTALPEGLRKPIAKNRRPLAVGASVMLGARKDLQRYADVDAAVGRQVPAIIDRLEAYRAAGRLPSKVIVQMGENGPVWNSDIARLKRVLRGVSRVVLVNVRITRSWEGEVNDILAQTAHGWEPARLVDWVTRSERPGMIYGDLTHPTARGARAYAAIVRRALLDRR